MPLICRITTIKFKDEDIPMAAKGFQEFTRTQKKDGLPYIVSMEAGSVCSPVQGQGYNFVAKSVFKCKADMDFYETECPAHQQYKLFLQKHAPAENLAVVCFTPSISYTL